MPDVHIKGGSAWQRDIAHKTVLWCLGRLELSTLRTLKIRVKLSKIDDCCGWCKPSDKSMRRFDIALATNQTIRDFVMTAVHEMIHVKQYARKEWLLDGEPEAWGIQEILTDELWKGNVL